MPSIEHRTGNRPADEQTPVDVTRITKLEAVLMLGFSQFYTGYQTMGLSHPTPVDANYQSFVDRGLCRKVGEPVQVPFFGLCTFIELTDAGRAALAEFGEGSR